MKEVLQRIAIAEICGWWGIEVTGRLDGQQVVGYPPGGFAIGQKVDLPNYPGDLNAMYSAESHLFPVTIDELNDPDLWKEYCAILPHLSIGHAGGVVRASADQRAEAFLRTFGKWKEEEA